MRKRPLLVIALSAAVGAYTTHPVALAAPPPAPEDVAARAANRPSNPFFAPSTLPFQAPPFDKITDADYQPAIEDGMRLQLEEVDAIANSADAPTFANTIEAMERSGALLSRVNKVFFGLAQ